MIWPLTITSAYLPDCLSFRHTALLVSLNVRSPGPLHSSLPSPSNLQPNQSCSTQAYPLSSHSQHFEAVPDIIICEDDDYGVTGGYSKCWKLLCVRGELYFKTIFAMNMFLFFLLLTVLQMYPTMNTFSLNTNITPIAVVGEKIK